jgi:peptidoglycan/LPS O-acetylase OafA/YrhL
MIYKRERLDFMQKINKRKRGRLYYFDYLRAFIIMIVILLHSLLPYVEDYIWYVSEANKSDVFAILSILIDVFIMPIMFFIAGYFAYVSLKKRGSKEFIRTKSHRILLPFIVGVLFFSPIMGYISVLSRGMKISYLEYWFTIYFKNFISSEHAAHYWFLALLFVFYLSFVVIYRIYGNNIDKLNNKSKKISKSQVNIFVLGFFIFGILSFFSVSIISPDDSWISLFNILVFQPTRATIYLFYFFLGIIVYLKNFKISDNLLKKMPIFITGTFLLSLIYLAFKLYFISLKIRPLGFKLINSMLHFTLCFLIFFTLILIFKKYFNKSISPLNRLAKSSYSIYFIHMIIVVIIQYLLLPYSISVYLKAVLAFILTAVLSYILSELYLKSYNYLLGMNKEHIVLEKQKQE